MPTRRWGPYVDLKGVTLGKMQEAHADSSTFNPGNANPVFFDTIASNSARAILYYRAHTSKRKIASDWSSGGADAKTGIYDYSDNAALVEDTDNDTGTQFHPDFDNVAELRAFIWDSQTAPGDDEDSPAARPHRRDSFILINAGRDQKYGTEDDITNF